MATHTLERDLLTRKAGVALTKLPREEFAPAPLLELKCADRPDAVDYPAASKIIAT